MGRTSRGRSAVVPSAGGGGGLHGLGDHGEQGCWSLLKRFLPAMFLPLVVSAFQLRLGESRLPLTSIATILGIIVSLAVPRGVLSMLTTAVAAALLLSACYVQDEVQPSETSMVQPLHPRDFLQRPRAERAVLVEEPDRLNVSGTDLAPATLETLSIVLPCAFEGAYAEKTVDAIWAHTRHRRIHEIIVVDDGSKPPLATVFPERLLHGGPGGPPVRMLRHEKTRGLIGAKKTGGDAATGDVIVFLDCHVSPNDGWEEAFLRQMKRSGDHRTVVVPTISSLDPDTWQENKGGPVSKACYLLWNADFTWLGNSGRDVPLMSGGLLALSRRWWQETEGYDEHMVAWGGENIDQSLRAWLCGGRIEAAEGATIAHMWRDSKNPKTTLKYPMPTEDVMRNKARAVTAWLDDFKEKALSFPEYEAFVTGQQQLGDMSNFHRLQKKMNCAPFASYIQRFSYVYIDGGLIPREVFQIREEKTGRCLERSPRESQPHGIVLAPCAGSEGGGISELQQWHGANRDRNVPGGPCCSGLMNWNFLQCLDAHGLGSRAQTFECEISGYTASQAFQLESSGRLSWGRGQGCLAPAERQADDSRTVALAACGVQTVEDRPNTFRLRRGAGGLPGGACATAIADGASVSGWKLVFKECDAADPQQVLRTAPMLDGVQVQVGDTKACLDIAGGTQVLVYPCYAEKVANQNQVWQLHRGQLVWEGQVSSGMKGFCLDARDTEISLKDLPVMDHFNLRTCTGKRGQRLRRSDADADGTFLIRDADTGKCLGIGSASPGSLERMLRLTQCRSDQRWRELQDRDQLQHAASTLCLDAGNEVVPIVYPCHVPKAQRKQRFHLVDDPGWVQLRKGWEDNGRKRYFEQCLDHSPEPSTEVVVQGCTAVEAAGTRWRRVGIHEPSEWRAWRSASTLPPGAPLLGETQAGGRAARP